MLGSVSILRDECDRPRLMSRIRQPKLALLLSLLVVVFVAPMAKADAIYTFFDQHNNIALQFTTPYIVTASTAPVPLTSFLVAPSGFVPCTLQIFNGAVAANTLGCTATGLIAGVQTSWNEIWIVMNSAAFPTAPGSFTIPFGDLLWAASGDIPVTGGSITVTLTPEPGSMLLLATGIGAFSLKGIRSRFARTLYRRVLR